MIKSKIRISGVVYSAASPQNQNVSPAQPSKKEAPIKNHLNAHKHPAIESI